MLYLEKLSEVLKQWDVNMGDERINNLSGLVSSALLILGSEDYKKSDFAENSLKYLFNRVENINSSTGVFVEFIVEGIITHFSNYFNEQINKREIYIENNEKMVERSLKVKATGKDVPVNLIKHTQERIEFMKSESYLSLAEKELKCWNELINLNFSPEEKEEMLSRTMQEEFRRNKEQMSDTEKKRLEEIISKMQS